MGIFHVCLCCSGCRCFISYGIHFSLTFVEKMLAFFALITYIILVSINSDRWINQQIATSKYLNNPFYGLLFIFCSFSFFSSQIKTPFAISLFTWSGHVSTVLWMRKKIITEKCINWTLIFMKVLQLILIKLNILCSCCILFCSDKHIMNI